MTPSNGKQLRIRDIAKLANVSTGTVDRVLHNRAGVNEQTRAKISKILEEIDYSPNLIAKTLASKTPMRFVMLIPSAKNANSFWAQPVLGVQQGADELSKFRVLVDLYTFDDSDKHSFTKMANRILKEKPQGVIFSPVFFPDSLTFIKELEKLEIPFVFVNTDIKNTSNIAYFGQDAFKSGYLSGKLMNYGLGKGTLLILKLVNNLVISRHVENRENGFKEFIKKNNLSGHYQIFDLEIDLLKKDEPFKSLSTFFDQHQVDGIFVPNSRSFKLVKCMKEHNVQVPLIIGYDLIPENIKHLEDGVISFLIGQRPEEQSYRAIKSLFNYIVLKQNIKKQNYSPIDIITKENIEFHKEFANE